jgi:hypothetical protein
VTKYATTTSALSSIGLSVSSANLGPNPVEQLGKRSAQKNDSSDSEPSVKNLPMKKLPKAVATQQARIPASVEVHSELQNFPEQESKTPMNKLQKENEVARTQFRPPNIRQSTPVADANMSSYVGFYNVRPQAVLPTQPFSRPPGYGHFKEPAQNTSAFQLYSGANYEELMQGVPMGMMMSELKTHSKLLLDLLDKVELHNKMLSVLIKDYQLNKYIKSNEE